ncbi:DUF2892 domain-containing protein [Patescibacteria group bacterium]|nr:DUF2892 domain-containing protein [Patescibacteria group bacterium]
MKSWQNESTVDRVIRFFVAIGAAFTAYYSHGATRTIWLIIAAIALINSVSGFNLLYKLVGISTVKGEK